MRSPSNDTSRDIASLLSPESRTPETEKLVRVLSQVRPQIRIDRTYQQELRARLMNKASKRYVFSLPLWTGVLSTAFAALVGVFALSSIFAPHPIDRVQPIAPVGGSENQAMLATMTTSDTIETQRSDVISAKKNNQNPQTPQNKNSEYMAMTTQSEDTLANIPMANMMMRSIAPTPPDTPAPVEGAALMAVSIPVMSLDDTTTIDTEIADMMSEISAIIYSGATTVILPIYPAQMSIYEKSGALTPTEITSYTGASLTPHTLDTINVTQIHKKIIALIGSDQIVGEGVVIYQERIIGTLHILVPVLSYTLTSGRVISVGLVRGYE